MKIAFTSCMCTSQPYHHSQPVWAQIQERNPDVLVLLGDSVYIDCPPKADSSNCPHPSNPEYNDRDFAKHLLELYQRQLSIPEFHSLISHVTTYAIWDDHDFLWNDADAADAQRIVHKGQAIYSSNLLACWRAALAGDALPATIGAAKVKRNYQEPLSEVSYDEAMPGYSNASLSDGGIVLHLTDGRSWRKAHRTLLGAAQRQAISNAIEANPEAVHLIASGSTLHAKGRNGWMGYPADYEWLLGIASNYRVLVLSGDVHRNEFHVPIRTSSSKKLYEVTASGAAVNFLGVSKTGGPLGMFDFSERFGLLEFTGDGIQASLFDRGVETSGPAMWIPSSFE